MTLLERSFITLARSLCPLLPAAHRHERQPFRPVPAHLKKIIEVRKPRLLQRVHHVPHHVDVRIPFYARPGAAAAIKAAFPDSVHFGKLRLRDYVAATRACKLYDFDEQRWLTYSAA